MNIQQQNKLMREALEHARDLLFNDRDMLKAYEVITQTLQQLGGGDE